jgi:hypothetical protein
MIMTQVCWTLGGNRFSDYSEFIRAVSEYNERIAPDDNEWQPDEVVSDGPIRIQFEAMWKDEDDLLDILVESDIKPVTMGRLLFALHNESAEFFNDTDHCYFEGLQPIEAGTFWLHTGS